MQLFSSTTKFYWLRKVVSNTVLGTYFMLKSFSCIQNMLWHFHSKYKVKHKWRSVSWNDSNKYYNTKATSSALFCGDTSCVLLV